MTSGEGVSDCAGAGAVAEWGDDLASAGRKEKTAAPRPP